jgi:hypothetical protein
LDFTSDHSELRIVSIKGRICGKGVLGYSSGGGEFPPLVLKVSGTVLAVGGLFGLLLHASLLIGKM